VGALRWTGKAFQLVGELLAADAFEEWVEAEGKAFVEERLKGMVLKGFRGRARARNALRHEMQGALARSDLLQAAITRHLDRLPALLQQAGRFMSMEKAAHFRASGYGKYVVAVPRALLVNEIRVVMREALSNSRELDRFTGFPTIFLERKADAGEKVLFDWLAKEAPVGIHENSAIVMGTHSDFDWMLGRPFGHYYVAYSNSSLEDKKARKELIKDLKEPLETLKVQLGSLSSEDMSSFRDSLVVS
jgi:hypothetical protein